MTITGTTRVFYILGDPVAQVRAPEVYNHLFQRHGIEAVRVPLTLPAAALPGFLAPGLGLSDLAQTLQSDLSEVRSLLYRK